MNPRKPQFEQLEPRLALANLIAVIDTGAPRNYKGAEMGIIRINFYDAKASTVDFDGHATAVAQEARKTAPAGTYFAFLKVVDAQGRISFDAVGDALEYVAEYNGKHTFVSVTLAIGTGGTFTKVPNFPVTLEDELAAVKAAGVTVIAAAGNSYSGKIGVSYPGVSPHVICAMASSGDRLQPWSQRISTGLAVDAGSTSRATGKLAGYVVRIYVAMDEPTPDAIAEVFRLTANWIRGGYGKVNIQRALEAA